MRKGTRKFFTTELFWTVLKFLPIITLCLWFMGIINHGETEMAHMPSNFWQILQEFLGIEQTGDSIAMELCRISEFSYMLSQLGINQNAFITLFNIGAWMIIVEFIHLAIDVLLCLPRLIRNMFDKIIGDKAE